MKKFLIFLIMNLFLISLVSSATITTFNNSLTTENLTFTGNQNITRWLSIPQGYLVNFSNITLRGYNGNDYIVIRDNENSSLYAGTYKDYEGTDEDWTTMTNTSNYGTDYIIENVTIDKAVKNLEEKTS